MTKEEIKMFEEILKALKEKPDYCFVYDKKSGNYAMVKKEIIKKGF